MSLDEVLQYFNDKYPNANVIKIPQNNPSELICEIDPAASHPAYSTAIAAISSSNPHYHRMATEQYEVISGTLLVRVGDKISTVYEREKVQIPVGQLHSASSIDGFALVLVTSQPGWTEQDHFLS